MRGQTRQTPCGQAATRHFTAPFTDARARALARPLLDQTLATLERAAV
jgi:hypothetical protein